MAAVTVARLAAPDARACLADRPGVALTVRVPARCPIGHIAFIPGRISLYMWIGFSLTEALALIGLVAPFIFKYSP